MSLDPKLRPRREAGRAASQLRRRACGLALPLLVAAPLAAAPRLVAIADVHADLPALRGVLQEAGVVDARGAWVGGDATVVQLGDLIDRGPAMRGTLDFVRGLERSAVGGGRFVSLLGNHEVMNLVGDLRYVTAANFAELAGADAEKRQTAAWKQFERWQKQRAAARGEVAPASGSAVREAWLAAHPPGLVEHREAFSPAGDYGRWLRAKPALLDVSGTLFVHGGVAPSRAALGIAGIDRQVHAEIARFDELRRGFEADGLVLPFFDLPELTLSLRAELAALDAADARGRAAAESNGGAYAPSATAVALRARLEEFLAWDGWSIFSSDGPLWFRGYSQWSDGELAARMPAILAALGVERIVVGHTPQAGGVMRSRFGGAAVLADTGMLANYFAGGRGSALEIVSGRLTAIYAGAGRQPLTPEAAAAEPAPPESAPRQLASEAAAAPTTTRGDAPPADDRPRSPYRDRDGKPLPFAGDDELLAFLRDADVVEVKEIGEGITKPRRLTLELDGVRVRGVFRSVAVEKRVATLGGGRREVNFRDFYGFEPAAYRLARRLGFDRVPPAELRRFKGESGSIQLWIENATTEGRRKQAGTQPSDALGWKRQLQMMLIWDALVGNTDRNQGNILFDADWRVWLIDHTRSFRQSDDVEHLERIIWCERGFYERLRALGDDEIRAAVDGLLRPGEIRGLLARRRTVVAHLDGLVRARGEQPVLFRWDD